MIFIQISIFYSFVANSIYLVLLVAAVFALRKHAQLKPLFDLFGESFADFAPSVSILAPAYNEQETVVESVKSFLMLNYPSFEVVVINDGSKDQTMSRLIEAFMLETIELHHERTISQTEVYGIYRSKIHPNLVVIDKKNGGKADALNVGLELAQHELFCAVDSDSLLEADALLRIVTPFLEDPGVTVASGGTVRIANGADVKFGRVEKVILPPKPLVLMQVVEYTRAFLCGRIGWNTLNATLVISGAFGMFSREAVMAVGGYTRGSIGEDMDLVLRLHRHFRNLKKPYAIVFVPDPVCWTEAPENFSSLQKQRDRWQRGLADSLIQNREMILNPRYGTVGLIAMPYFVLVELLGPVVELFSMFAMVFAYFNGTLNPHAVVLFFSATALYGTVLSIGSILIEEIFFSKYDKANQFLTLFLVCLLESIGYRQLSSVWRLTGLYKFATGDHSWGHLQRNGFTPKAAQPLPSSTEERKAG